MFILLLAHLASAACPAHSADIDAALDDAEASYTAMDLDRFAAAVATASADADCLGDRPARSTIAHLHRVEGLHAYFAGQDPDRAAKAFAAARAIEPAYVFPESLVPAGHPVAQTYGSLDPASAKSEAVAAPAQGRVEIDGRKTTTRPVDRPALMQVVTDDGAVAASGYVWPGEALPDYAVTMARSTATTGKPGPWVHRAPLLGLAVASLATSAGLLVMAADGRAEFDDSPTLGSDATDSERSAYRKELEANQSSTNTLAYGGYAAVGVGLAFGVVTVITW